MKDSKWCCEHINSGNIRFKGVLGELKELFLARNLTEVKEELGDVLYFVYCWLYSRFKINLPMIGAMSSVVKFTARLDVWEAIFENNRLIFDPKYLINGSNYMKIHKVELALELAKEEQEVWRVN